MSESGRREQRRAGRARRARSIEAAAVAGIAFSLLSSTALVLLSRYPSLDQSAAELAAWFDDPAHQTSLVGALGLAAISAIAFLWFVAVIRRRLGDREDRFFGTVFLGSGIAFVGVWLAGAAALAAPAVALAELAAAAASPASVSLAGGLGGGLILIVAPRLQAVFVFSTSTVILRSGVLPAWLAYLGYASGLLLLVVPVITRGIGLVMPAWVLVVSMVLLVTRPKPGAGDGGTGASSDASQTGGP